MSWCVGRAQDEVRAWSRTAGEGCAVAFGVGWALTGWQNHLVLEIVNAPLPDGIEPITLGPAEAF